MSIDSDLDSLPTEPGPTDADGVAGESIDAAVTSPDSLGRSGAPGERAEIGQPYVRPARLVWSRSSGSCSCGAVCRSS